MECALPKKKAITFSSGGAKSYTCSHSHREEAESQDMMKS